MIQNAVAARYSCPAELAKAVNPAMPGRLTAALAAYPVIILDGCDGTGKTTLAEALREQRGYTVTHSGRTPDGTDLADRYRQLLAMPGRIVLDRSFISELVYGPLLHDRSRLTQQTVVSLARTSPSVAERSYTSLVTRSPSSPGSGSATGLSRPSTASAPSPVPFIPRSPCSRRPRRSSPRTRRQARYRRAPSPGPASFTRTPFGSRL